MNDLLELLDEHARKAGQPTFKDWLRERLMEREARRDDAQAKV
jgi:hypothetical protein